MQIICPKCEYRQDMPDEKIPPKAEMATCPQCGEKFRFRTVRQEELSLEPEHAENDFSVEKADTGNRVDEVQKDDDSIWSSLENMGTKERLDQGEDPGPSHESGYEVPWENLDKTGFFPGFIESIKRVMLAPGAFFYRMPFRGLVMPLAFFLLIMVIQALATFIWNMAGVFPTTAQHGAGELGMGMMGMGSIFIIIIYPLFMGIWLFVASGITHIFLSLFQAGKSGFEGTFRATAYGSAPMILGLLPFVGPIAGAFWSLGVTIVGYKNIHETSFLKVIMAMMSPVLVIIIIAALLF